MIVRELLTSLGFRIDGNQINVYNTTINNIRQNADRAAASVNGLFAGFLGLGALRSITKIADTFQGLEFRVGELPQTVGDAGTAFDTVAGHAIAARQSVEQYANLYIRIGGATSKFLKTQEDVITVTDTVSKALVIGGASAREQASALEQLSQGFQAGKLQGNDFKIFFASVSSDFKNKFAAAAGTTIENLKEMSTKGTLTAEIIAKALIKIAPQFDESFKKVPLTFGQALTIARGKFSLFINRLNRESKVITKVAAFVIDSFNSIEKGLNNLVKILGGSTNALGVFAIALGAALAPSVVKGFISALTLLFSPAALFIASLFLIGIALQDMYTWLQGGESFFGDFLGPVRDSEGNLNKLAVAIGGVATAFAAMILVSPTGTLKLVLSVVKGLVLWLPFVAIRFWEFVAALRAGALAANGFAIAALIVEAPIWLIVAAIVAVVAIVYVLYKVFQQKFDGIRQIASDTWKSIQDDFFPMVDAITKKWQAFKDFFSIGANASINAQQGGLTPSAAFVDKIVNNATGQSSAPQVNVTVNQTLPPGTPQETADAAKGATLSAGAAWLDSWVNSVTGQTGQVQ